MGIGLGQPPSGGESKIAFMDFWSVTMTPNITIDTTPTDIALPSVQLPDLDIVPVRVIPIIKFRKLENSFAGDNKIDGGQYIQVHESVAGAWTNAILIPDDSLEIPQDGIEGGDVIIGADIIAEVTLMNRTYEFRWHDALADGDVIGIYDIQTGLRVYF